MAKQTLTAFLEELVSTPGKLKKYLDDRDGEINKANLEEAHKQLLRNEDLQGIQKVVDKESPGKKAMRIFAIC